MTSVLTDDQLSRIEHVVVLMLENRSFDHMLGFLYSDRGNRSPTGSAFEGLGGEESNPDPKGAAVRVFPIEPSTASPYFMPGADPGEGYNATNAQLFGPTTAPTPPHATNQGFVTDYAYTLEWEQREHWPIVPGTVAADIMGIFTPAMLPVLSGLARGFATCDQWFSAAPTETMPNRAFASAGTSQGHMDDATKSYTVKSIFGLLSQREIGWSIFGYSADPLTRLNFPDTLAAPDSHFGLFPDFVKAAAAGTLPVYSFLEPSWESTGNSQHPNYDVALGEQLIHDVYQSVRTGPGWNQTLLVITYDEHGGCYDHVAPPTNAVPPDASVGQFGFDFRRFGVRVPTVLVSPWIEAGSVFRVPPGSTPLDHTSILKTIERRCGLPALTARDAAAPDIGAALSLSAPRTDDPLAGIVVPKSSGTNPAAGVPSHLQMVQADLVAQLPVRGEVALVPPILRTAADYSEFIQSRTAAWKASR
jgi:phospholipase C